MLRRSKGIVEFIDRYGGRGSIRVLSEFREGEGVAECDRVKEVTSRISS